MHRRWRIGEQRFPRARPFEYEPDAARALFSPFKQGFEPAQLLQQASPHEACVIVAPESDGGGETARFVVRGDPFANRSRRWGDNRAAACSAGGFAGLFDAVAHARADFQSAPFASERSQPLRCHRLIDKPSFKSREADDDVLTRDNPDKRCRADAENCRYLFKRLQRRAGVVWNKHRRRTPFPRGAGKHASRDPRHRCLDGGPGDERLVTGAANEDERYMARNVQLATGKSGGKAGEVEAEQSHGGGSL